jgi:hypothetical protein
MIVHYQEKSVEVELHSHAHKVYEDEHIREEVCECESVTTVQAAYDFSGSHRVRVCLDSTDTYRSNPVWFTPDQARALASYLMFAANDADTLNKEFPTD